MHNVYIRPLQEDNALTSYQWRNEPEVWKFTGSKPDREITPEIEQEWIQRVLCDERSKRFAIIADEQYIGNIQLTNIYNDTAEYHIFIGNKEWWGKGVSKLATYYLLFYAKETLKLRSVFLSVREDNVAAIRLYEKSGFKIVSSEDSWIRMEIDLSALSPPVVSVFVMVYNHEKYLVECLEGILMQKTIFSYTIVVGEDCSTDQSRKILLKYQEKFPGKFKLILHEKNVGANANQIIVLNNCKGKYIAMCEGDDYWTDPHKLQTQIDFLEKNTDFILSAGLSIYIDADNNIITPAVSNVGSDYITFDIKNILHKSRFETATIVFRNQPPILFPEWFYSFGFDIDALILWLLKDNAKVHFLNKVISHYRYHAGGATKQNNYEEKLDYYIKMLDLFDNSTGFIYSHEIHLKKEKTKAAFMLHILELKNRILFILKKTPFYIRYRKHHIISFKTYVKYFLPKKKKIE